MSIEQMRAKILKAYLGEAWFKKVKNMPDDQVLAVYCRLLKQGRIK